MRKIIRFPQLIKTWDLARHVIEMERLCEHITKQTKRLKRGYVSPEDLAAIIRRVQEWSEQMEKLLVFVARKVR